MLENRYFQLRKERYGRDNEKKMKIIFRKHSLTIVVKTLNNRD